MLSSFVLVTKFRVWRRHQNALQRWQVSLSFVLLAPFLCIRMDSRILIHFSVSIFDAPLVSALAIGRRFPLAHASFGHEAITYRPLASGTAVCPQVCLYSCAKMKIIVLD